MAGLTIDLKPFIREIPDWPKKGILFRDITTLLANKQALAAAVDALCSAFKQEDVDYIAAVEARGFIFGTAVAEKLGVGFVPIRKKGKLPWKTERVTYDLEYGVDTLEIHRDAIPESSKVLMVDDLLATGGTMAAACRLIEKIGGRVVGAVFLIELAELGGREKLADYEVRSIISYD
jgi:adenine phosphoribosyltransferase